MALFLIHGSVRKYTNSYKYTNINPGFKFVYSYIISLIRIFVITLLKRNIVRIHIVFAVFNGINGFFFRGS